MTIDERIGMHLRAARKKAGLRLADIAGRVDGPGFSRSHLCELENGRGEWRLDRIEALCKLYGVGLGDFMVRVFPREGAE